MTLLTATGELSDGFGVLVQDMGLVLKRLLTLFAYVLPITSRQSDLGSEGKDDRRHTRLQPVMKTGHPRRQVSTWCLSGVTDSFSD